MDAAFTVLGELTSFQSLLLNEKPSADIIDDSGNIIEKDVKKTTHDQIALHGILQSGAVFSCHMRNGNTLDKALRWYIYGTKGEIEITGDGPFIAITPESVNVRLRESNSNSIEEIKITRPADCPSEFPQPAINVNSLYEAYRKGETQKFANFEDAVARHAFIDEVFKSSENKSVGKFRKV
jgi:predicted dehydrogenase